MAVRAEHLSARQRQPYRPAGDSRRNCSQRRMRPRLTFASESSADERIDDVHVLRQQAELLGQILRGVADALGRVVDRKLSAAPCRDSAVRLHRVVMLDGRAIGLCNLHRRRGGRRREVAPLRRRRSIAGIRHERIAQVLVENHRGLLDDIVDLDQCGGVFGLLECFRNHHRNVLPAVVDFRAEKRQALSRRWHGWTWHRGNIAMRDHRDHARRSLRRGSVEIAYATGRDGALEQDSVSEARRGKFSSVARTSGDLEAPVDAIHGRPDVFPGLGWCTGHGFSSRDKHRVYPLRSGCTQDIGEEVIHGFSHIGSTNGASIVPHPCPSPRGRAVRSVASPAGRGRRARARRVRVKT